MAHLQEVTEIQSVDLSEAKNLFQNELISDQINICRIRLLCKKNPGLIASVAGLRLRIWSLFLLGIDPSTSDLKHISTNNELEIPCQEQQVLEADVRRTRADIEDFRSHLWRKNITEILQGFCLKHNIQYKQGMNEVLAPFVYLCPPTVQQSSKLSSNLFEAFIFRYLERYFCLDDSSFLFKAFRMFHLLLMYHDPQLALHLHDNGFPPELYSPQWFLTLYSRGLPISHVMGLWDTLISIDDPAFTFFVGLCLLRRIRVELLLADIDSIPEIFKKLHFHGEEDVNAILADAVKLFQATPRSFCRNLRLCCVDASELHQGQEKMTGCDVESLHVGTRSSRNVAIQAVRQCAMISPQELMTFLSPTGASILSRSRSGDTVDTIGPVLDENISSAVQFVLIDIRSSTDIELSGGGIIPRAIPLDPEFIDQPDAFDRWLQHFDGTRGCNICIIDLPPGQGNAVSLWRRLILGEGDGTQMNINYGNMLSDGLHKTFTNTAGAINSLNHISGVTSGSHRRDHESLHTQDEDSVLEEEKTSPSIRLAAALQRASFPFISVLDGGFPALLNYLMDLRGTVEPIVIQHDSDRWSQFLKSTGRESYPLSCTNTHAKIRNLRRKSSESLENASTKIDLETHRSTEYKSRQRKAAKDFSTLELYRKGYEIAVKMGHQHTAMVLATKLREINLGQVKEDPLLPS